MMDENSSGAHFNSTSSATVETIPTSRDRMAHDRALPHRFARNSLEIGSEEIKILVLKCENRSKNDIYCEKWKTGDTEMK